MIANNENIEDIANLRLEYFKEYYDTFLKSDELILKNNIENYLEKHLNDDCFVFLKYKNNILVSSVIINIIEMVPNKKFTNGKYAEIYGVFTKKEYRKKGIATENIKESIEFLKSKQLSYIELDASIFGVNIYENCGFEIYEDLNYTKMKYYFK